MLVQTNSIAEISSWLTDAKFHPEVVGFLRFLGWLSLASPNYRRTASLEVCHRCTRFWRNQLGLFTLYLHRAACPVSIGCADRTLNRGQTALGIAAGGTGASIPVVGWPGIERAKRLEFVSTLKQFISADGSLKQSSFIKDSLSLTCMHHKANHGTSHLRTLAHPVMFVQTILAANMQSAADQGRRECHIARRASTSRGEQARQK